MPNFIRSLLYAAVRLLIPSFLIRTPGRPSVYPTHLIPLPTSRPFFLPSFFCQPLPSSVTRLLVSLSVNNSVSYSVSVCPIFLAPLINSVVLLKSVYQSLVRPSVSHSLSVRSSLPAFFNPFLSLILCRLFVNLPSLLVRSFVRSSVRPSVRPSVRQSVSQSVSQSINQSVSQSLSVRSSLLLSSMLPCFILSSVCQPSLLSSSL